MHPRIYVIGYNNQERLDRCLESIPPKYERVVLDNGATDLTVPHGVEYIKTGPGWFTPCFNFALRDAMKHNAIPIICNDDIEVELDCFEKMLEAIAQGAGIVSPMIVDMNMPDQIIMGGTAQAYPSGMHLVGTRGLQHNEPREYPWLPFCVVAVNPLVIEECGLLDRNLKMIFSDSDYSIRCRHAGYSVLYLPSAVIKHEQSSSIKAERAAKNQRLEYQMLADRIYFEGKYGGNILRGLS